VRYGRFGCDRREGGKNGWNCAEKKPAKMCATASASCSDAAAELIPDRAGGKTECRIAMPIHNAEKQKQSGPPTTPPLEYPGFAIVFPVVPRYFWNSSFLL